MSSGVCSPGWSGVRVQWERQRECSRRSSSEWRQRTFSHDRSAVAGRKLVDGVPSGTGAISRHAWRQRLPRLPGAACCCGGVGRKRSRVVGREKGSGSAGIGSWSKWNVYNIQPGAPAKKQWYKARGLNGRTKNTRQEKDNWRGDVGGCAVGVLVRRSRGSGGDRASDKATGALPARAANHAAPCSRRQSARWSTSPSRCCPPA